MRRKESLSGFLLCCCLLASLGFASTTVVQAKEAPLETSPEGLVLRHSKDARLVYVRPGASLAQYDRVAILDTFVEFEKNWQRDYNANVGGIQGRVTTKDMDRMKAAVASEFRKVFTAELQKGGYQVVDAAAPDVLILRPAIINLKVTAPDLQRADITRTFVRSAGQMTLYLELWDSANNMILARIMDPQEDDWGGRATRASNKFAMDEILREWAEKLRKHLDAAQGKTGDS